MLAKATFFVVKLDLIVREHLQATSLVAAKQSKSTARLSTCLRLSTKVQDTLEHVSSDWDHV